MARRQFTAIADGSDLAETAGRTSSYGGDNQEETAGNLKEPRKDSKDFRDTENDTSQSHRTGYRAFAGTGFSGSGFSSTGFSGSGFSGSGFSGTGDRECVAIMRCLAPPGNGIAATLLEAGAVLKVQLSSDRDDGKRAEREGVLGQKLLAKSQNQTAVGSGTGAMDLHRAVSLVFRSPAPDATGAAKLSGKLSGKPSTAEFSGKPSVTSTSRVGEAQNVEMDLLFASAADAKDVARLFETLMVRDTAAAGREREKEREIDGDSKEENADASHSPAAAASTPFFTQELRGDDSRSWEDEEPQATRRELRRIDAFRQNKIAAQGYPEINAEFRHALTMLQAGVPFVTHHYNGVAPDAIASKETVGTLRYGRDRRVHILREGNVDNFGDVTAIKDTSGSCNGPLGFLRLLTASCREPDDPVVDECFSVANLHSAELGHPVPTMALLRHVPEPLLKQSVSLVCKDAQVRMTFESEEVAKMVAKFLRTVIWHQEQQYLRTSRVLQLDFSDDVRHGRSGLMEAKCDASVG